MEENEEEEDDDNFPGFGEYSDFPDTVVGEAEEEIVEEDEPAEDLGQAIRDAQRDCESEKERMKFQRMLEDHAKLLYPHRENSLFDTEKLISSQFDI